MGDRLVGTWGVVVVLYQSPKLPPHAADPVSKTKTPGDKRRVSSRAAGDEKPRSPPGASQKMHGFMHEKHRFRDPPPRAGLVFPQAWRTCAAGAASRRAPEAPWGV